MTLVPSWFFIFFYNAIYAFPSVEGSQESVVATYMLMFQVIVN